MLIRSCPSIIHRPARPIGNSPLAAISRSQAPVHPDFCERFNLPSRLWGSNTSPLAVAGLRWRLEIALVARLYWSCHELARGRPHSMYGKLLNLIPPEKANRLQVPAEAPVLVSPFVTGKEPPCGQCS